MVTASRLDANCLGLIRPNHSKPLFERHRHNVIKFNRCITIQQMPERIAKSSGYFSRVRMGTKCDVYAGKDNRYLSVDDDLPPEPFLLTLTKEVLGSLRSLFIFLVEQPSQLKYIEWPRFQSTLKTATLTLILVAVLIVALSSVDSALSYCLAFLLRRPS